MTELFENCPGGFVVAIDGPAGAGKSTVAKQLADRLGFEFLDTGAMYRCVTLAVLRNEIDTSDESAVIGLAEDLNIELGGTDVTLNGQDVSHEIRQPEIGAAIGKIADNVSIRKLLSNMQRDWANGRFVVTEGRDQGSEVFFDAGCKVFLNASSEERARRRQEELSARGIDLDYQTVLDQQNQRDREDYSREVGALRKAEDAIEFCTDGKTLPDVIQALEKIVRSQLEVCLSGDDNSATRISQASLRTSSSHANGE